MNLVNEKNHLAIPVSVIDEALLIVLFAYFFSYLHVIFSQVHPLYSTPANDKSTPHK